MTRAWRGENLLVPAEIELLSGELLPLNDQNLLVSLEHELADLLIKKNIRHLTLAKMLDDDRELTQAIAEVLFKRGAAGIQFPSKHDGGWCAALFEGRARLQPKGDPLSLVGTIPEFEQVCREFELDLEPEP